MSGRNITPSHSDGIGDNALHQAAFVGDLETLTELLQNGVSNGFRGIFRSNGKRGTVDVNLPNRLGCTALRLASTAGHVECVKLLLDHGANVNAADIKAQTPLFVAVKNQHSACVRALLEAGADPDGCPLNLCTPAYIAAMNGYGEALEVNKNSHRPSDNLWETSFLAAWPFPMLMFHGANPNQCRINFGSECDIAISYHHLDCLRILLKWGANPDGGESAGDNTSPTVCTNLEPETDIVTCSPASYQPPPLPSYFAEAISNPQPQSTLYHAAVRHNVEAEYVQLLYDFGASLFQCDSNGLLACDLQNRGGSPRRRLANSETDNECVLFIKFLIESKKSAVNLSASDTKDNRAQKIEADQRNKSQHTFKDLQIFTPRLLEKTEKARVYHLFQKQFKKLLSISVILPINL